MNLTATRRRAAITLIQNFLNNMQTALEHIDDELHWTDENIWPAATMGDGGSRATGSKSAVERLVIDSRQKLRDNQAQLWDDFNAMLAIAHSGSSTAVAAAKRLIPGHDAERCNGGANKQLEGWVVWRHTEPVTDPDGITTHQTADCTNWPDTDAIIDGMCTRCLNRMNDWRIGEGLERIARDGLGRNYLAVRNVEIGPNGKFQRAC